MIAINIYFIYFCGYFDATVKESETYFNKFHYIILQEVLYTI